MNTTRGRARVLGTVMAGALGTLLTVGAVAYACSSQAVLELQQSSGSPGATIAGTGWAFSKTLVGPGQQVQIRWNSTSDSVLWAGPSDADGRIAFEFKVPDTATNGHYSIVATQGNSVGRTPFEVVGGASSPTNTGTTNTGSTGSTNTGSTNTGSTGSTNTGSTGSTNTGSTNTGSTDSGGSTTTNQATTGSTNTAGTAATSEEPAASSTSGDASSNATATATAASPAAATRVVAPGSTADPALPRRAASPAPRRSDGSAADPATAAVVSPGPGTAATPAVVEADEPTPSAASAAGDMWSGFGSGPRPSLSPDAATTTASGGSMLPGLVLFSTGLVAFAGGLSLTLTRRRRSLATTT